jgi:atypical dual specificity phosphatase
MPQNFSFILEGTLAGMERPGSHGKLRDDLEFLRLNSIQAIVTLTETPLEKAFIEEFGFRYLHLPIADFTPPDADQIDTFLTFLRENESNGRATLVHCAAGLGRTGTMLACALVARGLSAEAAIDTVRTQRPYSIETEEQEDAIRAFAALLAKRREKDKLRGGEGPA